MYTHPTCPIPFLWNVTGQADFVNIMWELFFFLQEKGCYEELSDSGLEAHRSNVAALEALADALAAGEGIPDALLNEARYKVDKYLPDAKATVERLGIEALLYTLITEDHNEGALLKFMDLRKELPNETWVTLSVKTPDGCGPAKPAEKIKPRYLLVSEDGEEHGIWPDMAREDAPSDKP